MNTKTQLEIEACRFATIEHGRIGHLRKYTHEPYIVHPMEVAEHVRLTDGHTPEMLAAAWLHDTVEDTMLHIKSRALRLQVIHQRFGPVVGRYVDELSDVTSHIDGNRASRKLVELERIAKISAEAKTIKLADLFSNTRSILQHDPGFAKIYMPEKRDLLEVLREGDQVLYRMVKGKVESYFIQYA